MKLINNYEFYHGVVLSRIIDSGKTVTILKLEDSSNSSYVINNSIGLYIKYSTKRITPWRFTFHREHQDRIKEMSLIFPSVYVVLVCNEDGVCALSFSELKKILDENHEETEWISAGRFKREKYEVKGKDGKLKFKIADSHFPSKIFEKCNENQGLIAGVVN